MLSERKKCKTVKKFKNKRINSETQELTVTSIILGIILAVVFGGANAYLGLRVGLTISASIPAAVISMGVIRFLLKKDSLLENNMVQTIGSAGESLAAGAIYTLPAIFMWADEGNTAMPSFQEIVLLSLCGGLLGVLFMIPLRKMLIVKEHNRLPYPEGRACSEVLLAGERGGEAAGTVFKGLGIAMVYKFLSDGLKLFPSEVDYTVRKVKGAGIGMDVLPALVGVGYICGMKVASYMLAGGIISWLVLMPLIATFGDNMILYPGTDFIENMGTWDIWRNYIRYIGAGAVATGGIISLIKSFPMIIKTFKDSIAQMRSTQTTEDEESEKNDLSFKIVLLMVGSIGLLMWLLPTLPISFLGTIMILLFGFFFATVSARMVGSVGSSNNPVSGMAIATLLLASGTLKIAGKNGYTGMVAAIAIGTVVCIIAAMAGDTSQDLKTGFLLGASPKKQQIGELIGVTFSALAIGGTLYLLHAAWGYGTNQLPAPQATLMKMVVEGVMHGNLPWILVLIGTMLAIAMEILAVPVMPFAVGLYLPLHLSTAIMSGGILRFFYEKYARKKKKENMVQKGVLFSSGLIAGEGLMGIILAVFALVPYKNGRLDALFDLSEVCSLGNAGGLACFVVLIYIFVLLSKEK